MRLVVECSWPRGVDVFFERSSEGGRVCSG